MPIPDITESDDLAVKVTGTTICESDLHLYHGEIITPEKGDILGAGRFSIFTLSSFQPNSEQVLVPLDNAALAEQD